MKIIRFLKEWNELLTMPVALLMWWFSGDILRWVDPTAGVFDAGILQVFLLATIGLLFGHALIWLMLRLSAKDVYDQFDDFLNNNQNITTWQRGVFSLSYFFLLLLSWVLLVNALA